MIFYLIWGEIKVLSSEFEKKLQKKEIKMQSSEFEKELQEYFFKRKKQC